MEEGKNTQQIKNQLYLVMIDRMLKEKYNEIEYLAIQPPRDPAIAEINQKDLDWLLCEHEKCEKLEQQNFDLKNDYMELETRYNDLEDQYSALVNSRTYRWGMRLSKIVRIFLAPFRMLRGNRE